MGGLAIAEKYNLGTLDTPLSEIDDELKHYGVKGMKWGVRRSQRELDRAAGRRERKSKKKFEKERVRDAKRTAKADVEIAKINAKANKKKPAPPRSEDSVSTGKKPAKSARSMDSAELQAAVNRMNLERNYAKLASEMTPKKPTAIVGEYVVSKAKKAGNKALDRAIENVVGASVDALVPKDGIGDALKKSLDRSKDKKAESKKDKDSPSETKDAPKTKTKSESRKERRDARAERLQERFNQRMQDRADYMDQDLRRPKPDPKSKPSGERLRKVKLPNDFDFYDSVVIDNDSGEIFDRGR